MKELWRKIDGCYDNCSMPGSYAHTLAPLIYEGGGRCEARPGGVYGVKYSIFDIFGLPLPLINAGDEDATARQTAISLTCSQ